MPSNVAELIPGYLVSVTGMTFVLRLVSGFTWLTAFGVALVGATVISILFVLAGGGRQN